MDKAVTSIFLLIAMGTAFYLLYINGFVVINAKRAVLYFGFMGGRKATFTSCTGYTKRVIKFDTGGPMNFDFHLELSKGEVVMELLDSTKQCVLKLDRTNPRATLSVDAPKRYYLVFRFQSASGNYLLTWE